MIGTFLLEMLRPFLPGDSRSVQACRAVIKATLFVGLDELFERIREHVGTILRYAWQSLKSTESTPDSSPATTADEASGASRKCREFLKSVLWAVVLFVALLGAARLLEGMQNWFPGFDWGTLIWLAFVAAVMLPLIDGLLEWLRSTLWGIGAMCHHLRSATEVEMPSRVAMLETERAQSEEDACQEV
mmetsp:Transcript_4069/g.15707  ORF Transcript_4069/g.15707 Transcript_4069/m.15707 type:complete len:188 (-) Transcript_4069:73-636(-)